jgi:branched-chain amino acid transport system permease protein
VSDRTLLRRSRPDGSPVDRYRSELRLIHGRPEMITYGIVTAFVLAVPFIFALPIIPPAGLPWSATFTAINVALIAALSAFSFNLLLGYVHQISMAHGAFLALGAVIAAELGAMRGWSIVYVLPVAAVIGAIVGVLVGMPALRLRGLYLLVATLGVHFIAVLLFKKYQVANFGFGGISYPVAELPAWFPGPLSGAQIYTDEQWYWFLLVVVGLTILFGKNIVRTRYGRAFLAVRDQDIVAAITGVDPSKVKILAFAVSSAMATMAGVLGAFFFSNRAAESFTLEVVLFFAIMVVVGGFASVQGSILGALFVTLVPLYLDWFTRQAFADSQLVQNNSSAINAVIFGALIVIVLRYQPDGIAGIWQAVRRRILERRATT